MEMAKRGFRAFRGRAGPSRREGRIFLGQGRLVCMLVGRGEIVKAKGEVKCAAKHLHTLEPLSDRWLRVLPAW